MKTTSCGRSIASLSIIMAEPLEILILLGIKAKLTSHGINFTLENKGINILAD